MDDELIQLIASPSPIKRTAPIAKQLRSKMPAIEKLIANGMSHEELVELLKTYGYTLTLNTFRSMLYRYRRKHGIKEITMPVAPVNGNSPEQPACETPPEDNEEKVSDDGVKEKSNGNLNDVLEARRRGNLGEQYLNAKPQLFKRSSKNESSRD